MTEKGIFGNYPGPEEIRKAESAMTGEQKKLSRHLLAATRRDIRRVCAEIKAGKREFGSSMSQEDNYWNEQLKNHPGNKELLYLREVYENAKKIVATSISDKINPLDALENELKKLDKAFGPETEAEAMQIEKEYTDDFLQSLNAVVLKGEEKKEELEEPEKRADRKKWIN